jgi:hypothetical protein
MADYEWTWPKKIERDIIERALTLDFLPEARNLVFVGRKNRRIGLSCAPTISHRKTFFLVLPRRSDLSAR